MEPPIVHSATDDDGAGCRLVVDGYNSLVVEPLAEGLRVSKSTVVKYISATMDGVSVKTACGAIHQADYTVVTVPLGVLKGKNEVSRIEFTPALPEEKQVAISRLGMGSHNKVVLRFDQCFWPSDTPQLNCTDPRFQWLNLHAFGKHGVLLTHIWPPLAYGWDGMSDDEIRIQVMSVLRKMLNKPEAPEPIDIVITRWDSDPFSMGSYSFGAVGSTKEDTDALRKPCGHGRIVFAGEATSALASQCVHGAYITGTEAAKQLLERARACDTEANPFVGSANSFAGFGSEEEEDDDDDEKEEEEGEEGGIEGSPEVCPRGVARHLSFDEDAMFAGSFED